MTQAGGGGDGNAPGRLFVVSTPIGNMGDFSFRGVETLRQVSAVYAEDTRHSRHLLDRYALTTPLVAYHEHNEAKLTPRIVERLLGGESVALVSDAGTPLLSDPGARLVQAAIAAGVPVVPVPGASALLSALVVAGLPAEPFTFFGFLPRGGAERAPRLVAVAQSPYTTVLYEAPGRVVDTLSAVAERAGADRPAAVARELTKLYEDVRRGTLAELVAYYAETPPKGEVVIVIAGAPAPVLDESALRERARELRAQGYSVRDTATELAREFDAARNLAYRVARDAE
ncbi:MAG: 16S rRNA (cytidine(1402)-2'-O)-methyltransferase [Gemmatimonadetes bacterium 21-71-4]|nr:MAG: 16S rRNA (cytidine(1402)-2'-O)-methyltransferase [Gemmatimonadetes bacterium 21-71-4]